MIINRFLLAISFSLALAFIFSCSSDNEEPNIPQSTPSSDSSAEQRVFCKQNSGACLDMSISACMELVNAGVAQIVSNCDAPPPSSSSVPSSSSQVQPPPPSSSSRVTISGYCDYGPITEYGGGCFPMATEDDLVNCAAWGTVVNSCPVRPSSSSVTQPSSSSAALPPNALEITLTAYKELSPLDAIGYGDPRISFRVRDYAEKSLQGDVTTKILLSRDDITEWAGTVRDTVTIRTFADSIIVNPIVIDDDSPFNDENVSPPGVYILKSNIRDGVSTNNIESKNDKVSVTYRLRFFRR